MWSWLKSLLSRKQPPPSREPIPASSRRTEERVTAARPTPRRAAAPPPRAQGPTHAIAEEKRLGLDWRPVEVGADTDALFTTEPDAPAGAIDRGPIVGIDLGTTHSVVAVVRGSRVEVIPNQEGDNLTPSVVAFTEGGEVLVGAAAARQAAANPRRTVWSIKRFLGRHRDAIRALAERVPYEVVTLPTEPPGVQIGERRCTPAEIVSFILAKLKDAAEVHLRQPVRRAVLTVPAHADSAQRNALLDAARLAGFDLDWVLEDPMTRRRVRQPLRIVNEPTAAALAHARHSGNCRLAVFHMGGGTFDVSIIDSGDGVFQVKAVGGDTQLGGDDFDQALADHLLATLPPGTQRLVRRDPAALQRLRDAAERAKKDLSQSDVVPIDVPCLVVEDEGPRDLRASVTRVEFERRIEPLVQRCRACILATLADAGYQPADVEEVLLVGGMTRVPRLRALFRELFGRDGSRGIHPDEVVAVGAALHGAALALGSAAETLLLDATPLPLGLAVGEEGVKVLIARHTTIPVQRSEVCTTVRDDQPGVSVRVFEGTGTSLSACRFLGQLDLDGLALGPRGRARLEVTFDVDANSILRVTARDLDSGRTKTLRITEGSAAQRTPRVLLAARDQAERACREAEGLLASCAGRVTADDRARVEALVERLHAAASATEVAAIHRAADALMQALEALRHYLATPTPTAGRRDEDRPSGDTPGINLEL